MAFRVTWRCPARTAKAESGDPERWESGAHLRGVTGRDVRKIRLEDGGGWPEHFLQGEVYVVVSRAITPTPTRREGKTKRRSVKMT